MGNMKPFTQETSKTVQAIYAHHKKTGDAEPSRGYLGASVIGHECSRYLWFLFRKCCKPEFSGRMYRLFETGDLEEFRFTKELRAIGCEVHDTDGNGNQFEVNALGGHFSGHMDSAIYGLPEAPKTWHVGEYKTHNTKSFVKLKKEGVKVSKPLHYAQMQIYMHLSGMRRALYLARNKDTDELYSERIKYNKEHAEAYIERARAIITRASVPDRITNRSNDWRCKYCDAWRICWGNEIYEKNGSPAEALPVLSLSCRQCCHATPDTSDAVGGARWTCEHGMTLCIEDQGRACNRMLVLPDLISFAETVSSGLGCRHHRIPGWIKFRNHSDAKEWIHGEGGFSAEELLITPRDLLCDGMVEKSKELFSAEIQGVAHNILARYPEEDCEIIYRGPKSGLKEAWDASYGKAETLSDMVDILACDTEEYSAQEYEGGWVVIEWKDGDCVKPLTGTVQETIFEIRKGKE